MEDPNHGWKTQITVLRNRPSAGFNLLAPAACRQSSDFYSHLHERPFHLRRAAAAAHFFAFSVARVAHNLRGIAGSRVHSRVAVAAAKLASGPNVASQAGDRKMNGSSWRRLSTHIQRSKRLWTSGSRPRPHAIRCGDIQWTPLATTFSADSALMHALLKWPTWPSSTALRSNPEIARKRAIDLLRAAD